MDKIKVRKIITTIIFLVAIITVAITYFIVRKNQVKGENCNLSTIVEKDNYKLSFTNDYGTRDDKAVLYLTINITNTSSEAKDYDLTNMFYITNKGKRVKVGETKVSVEANDSYSVDTWCTYSNYSDTGNYVLHFKINGTSYNLHNYAETHKN